MMKTLALLQCLACVSAVRMKLASVQANQNKTKPDLKLVVKSTAAITASKSTAAITASLNHCEAFPGKRAVLVTLNKNYVDSGLFFNWYMYAAPWLAAGTHAGKTQLVIDVPDEQVHDSLINMHELPDDVVIMDAVKHMETLGKRREAHETKNNPYKQPKMAGLMAKKVETLKLDLDRPYNSSRMDDLMKHRIKSMDVLLKQGCTVLQSDVDMVWKGNVFDDLEDAGQHDMILADDSHGGVYHMSKKAGKVQRPDTYNFCGCFMSLSPKLAKTTFMEEWANATVFEHGNDQRALNKVIKQHSDSGRALDYGVVPENVYARGPATKEGARMIHANWFEGGAEDKIYFLKQHKSWHKNTEEWLEKMAWIHKVR